MSRRQLLRGTGLRPQFAPSGNVVSVEAGCSSQWTDGVLRMVVPTGTARTTPVTAGVRAVLPLRDLRGELVSTALCAAGLVRARYVAGMSGALGHLLWLGVVDRTDLATAVGGGILARDLGTGLEVIAWRLAAGGVYSTNATPVPAAAHTRLDARWMWAGDRALTLVGGGARTATAHVAADTRTASGTMGAGTLHAFIGLGLDASGSAGGTVDLALEAGIQQLLAAA